MSLAAVLVLAVALSVDAMSVGAALALRHRAFWQRARIAACFGLCQALMPVVGCYVGELVLSRVARLRPWIVLAVLGALGVRMILPGDGDPASGETKDVSRGGRLLALSVAVSIDALAAGVTLGHAEPPLYLSVASIGLTTGSLTMLAMSLAARIPDRFLRYAEILAGLVLIGLGMLAFFDA